MTELHTDSIKTRLRTLRDHKQTATYEYESLREVLELRTQLQRAEELLRGTRDIMAGKEQIDWNLLERIDAFLGERHD